MNLGLDANGEGWPHIGDRVFRRGWVLNLELSEFGCFGHGEIVRSSGWAEDGENVKERAKKG